MHRKYLVRAAQFDHPVYADLARQMLAKDEKVQVRRKDTGRLVWVTKDKASDPQYEDPGGDEEKDEEESEDTEEEQTPEEELAELLDIEENKEKFGNETTASDEDIEEFKSHPVVQALGTDFNLEIIAGDDDELERGELHRAMHIAAHIKKGIDEATNFCQVNPPACKGNLGIIRDNMPQIMDKSIQELLDSDKEKDRLKGKLAIEAGAKPTDTPQKLWFDKLKEDGIDITDDKIEVGKLIASQREIKAEKSYGIAKSYLTGGFDDLPKDPILVARDPKTGEVTVIDGHHRYAGLLLSDPEKKMTVKVIEAPIRDALEKSFEVPGVFRLNLQDEAVDMDTPLDLAREPGTTWKQQNGKFYGKNKKGEAGGPFKDEEKAKAFASGKKQEKAAMTLRKDLLRIASESDSRDFKQAVVELVTAASKDPDGGDSKIEGGDDKGSEDPGEHPKEAATKVASFPYLDPRSKNLGREGIRDGGLTKAVMRNGDGFALYNVDKKKNHSKFYEGMVIPDDAYPGMHRAVFRWGAMTDNGFTGRVDGKKYDEKFRGLSQSQALKALQAKKRAKLGRGYIDTMGPKHIDPVTGKKLKQGEYPIGLARDVGFGWGVQEMAFCVPALRQISEQIDAAMDPYDGTPAQVDLAAALKLVTRVPDSTMAGKIKGYIAKVMREINRGSDDMVINKKLMTIKRYLDKQMALCD